jgi:hypothetical protein
LWVVNAPSYGLNSNNTIENFVNKYMMYDIDGKAPNLYEAQTHCHKNICIFHHLRQANNNDYPFFCYEKGRKIKLFVILSFHG